MKRSAFSTFAVLLLVGCAESVRERELANDNSAANANAASNTPTVDASSTPAIDAADGAPSVDAKELLVSTLQNAKAENKRVLVHLGAPW